MKTSDIPYFPFIPVLPMMGLGLLAGNFYLSFKIYQKLKTRETQRVSESPRGQLAQQQPSIGEAEFIRSENLSPDDFGARQAY